MSTLLESYYFYFFYNLTSISEKNYGTQIDGRKMVDERKQMAKEKQVFLSDGKLMCRWFLDSYNYPLFGGKTNDRNEGTVMGLMY